MTGRSVLGARHRLGQRGITLVELMIAMTLGLVLGGVVLMTFLGNQQVYRQVDQLARLQENARVAFEFMARDLREAGGIPCDSRMRVASVVDINATTPEWWGVWGAAVLGDEGDVATSLLTGMPGSGFGSRIAGANLDALRIFTATQGIQTEVVSHDDASDEFEVRDLPGELVPGALAMVCDFSQATIFQITDTSSGASNIIEYGGSATPGNCEDELGSPSAAPLDCRNSAGGTTHVFASGSYLSRVEPYLWYVGDNARGGQSLFRLRVGTTGTTTPALQIEPEEIIDGVAGLDFQFLERTPTGLATSYRSATAVADWSSIVAVYVELTLATTGGVGSDGAPITRTIPMVFHIRGRAL